MNSSSRDIDKFSTIFLLNLAIIAVVGIIMVYSASYIYAKELYGSSTYFLFRQFIFTIFGCGLMYFISRMKMSFWMKYGVYIHWFFTFLLVLTYIPGIGISTKGACRWIDLGMFTLQPAEYVKYSLIIVCLNLFDNFEDFLPNKKIHFSLAIAIPLLLIIRQPDFGSFFICMLVVFFTCFLSTFPRKLFYAICSVGTIVGVAALFMKAYRIKRLLTFLDPWSNPQTSGFQIIQSYLAFAEGGFWGQGLGNSNEKLFYLPEAHNDFIFSVIGEEVGFFGIFLLVALFVSLIYWGLRLAIRVENRVGTIMITSIIFVFGVQSVLNMGVVLGLLPTKGLNLPFISYGGSALVASFMGMGLIFCIVNSCKTAEEVIYNATSESEPRSSTNMTIVGDDPISLKDKIRLQRPGA